MYPAEMKFPKGAVVYVQGFTNAAYGQQAKITGDGVDITLNKEQDVGRTKPPTAQFTSPGSVKVTVTHDGRPSDLQVFQIAEPEQVGKNCIAWVGSEDATDKDYNDCALVFYCATHSM